MPRSARRPRKRPRSVVALGHHLSLDDLSGFDIVDGVDPLQFLPLPQAQFLILGALSESDMHGYAIMQHVEESSRSLVKMGPATLYGTLKKLGDLGLAEELAPGAVPDVDKRRRYYRLTELGRSVCLAEAERLADLAARTRSNLLLGQA